MIVPNHRNWSTTINYYRDVLGSVQTVLTRTTRISFTDLYKSRNGETSKTSLDNETSFQFVTAQQLENRRAKLLQRELNNIVILYKNRGFTVRTLFMDNEFAPIKNSIVGVTVNCCAPNEHVPEAERMIRVIKERVRAYFCMLPFKRIPARMLVELVRFCVS